MSGKSHPSEDATIPDASEGTTIPDELYFGAMQDGAGVGRPQTNREAFVRSMTHGPVEQQLVNIAGGLYDVGRKVDNLEEKMDKRMSALENRMGSLENMMRLFIDEMRSRH